MGVVEIQLFKMRQTTKLLQAVVTDLSVSERQRFKLCQTAERAIVNCCVLRNSLSGGFLHDSVLEGTSFDDECDLFVAA